MHNLLVGYFIKCLVGELSNVCITIYHDFKKFAILKKGIGIESQKTIQTSQRSQKYRNKMDLNCCYRTKVDSKAFAIPILTARL